MPGCAKQFALPYQGPLLCGRLGGKVPDECGPTDVALDVSDVKVVEVAEGAREVGDGGELGGAGVGGFEGVEDGVEGGAAVGVEELGGEDETGPGVRGGGRGYFSYCVACLS